MGKEGKKRENGNKLELNKESSGKKGVVEFCEPSGVQHTGLREASRHGAIVHTQRGFV